MATNQISGFIQRLRGVLRDGAGLTDGQLLADYLSRRDEAAVAALVRRHGPMVWGVCRRVLHNHHDAEDAFQTTFLVLVRKAASIASRELLAHWLYGVAHQTALKARATAAKRKGRERQVTDTPEPAGLEQELWRDLQPLLDEELSRLPAKYRGVIVLCDLEGKTRKEAAAQLRCPEGTVAGRLARARIMLAKRLTRRGLALSGGALAVVLAQQAAPAGVPASVAASTIKAASLLAAGKAAAAGTISVKVAALTEGVMKAMLFSKLKAVVAVVLILGFVATGATVLTCRTAAGQEDKPPVAEKPVATSAKQEPEKKEEFAWGKEVNGLQLGLALVPADKVAYRAGEKIKLEVEMRNVSNAAITIRYRLLNESPPEITDAKGEKVNVAMPPPFDYYAVPTERILKPGETVTLYKPEVAVEEIPEGKADATTHFQTPTIRPRPRKYHIAFGRMVESHPTLSTGTVEFEVKDKSDKESSEKKEAFTAWGKEAGGLQAGLGFRPSEHRTYHIGETVTLVVRVRNVGKEAVKFQYLRNFFMEIPPTVTDGEGKPVPFRYGVVDLAKVHLPVDVNLAPGKEIDLYELKLELRPASESGQAMISTLYGTGKFQIQYERVFGNSSAGQIKLDSALSKLATGKLELEIKPEASPKGDGKTDKPVNSRVSIDKAKATVEGQLDEASTLVLRIGAEKDKLFWEARRKDTPGSAMVRFSEEGAKRFWGDKAQSAGAFKAVVELSDKILMSDGKFATGFIYSVAVSEGAATEKQNLIGSMIYVPIPKTGTLQDFLARSLAGDGMPFGQLLLRDESKIVRKEGVVTFADIRKGDGALVPVSFVMEKSHSSLKKEATVTK